MKFKSQKSSYDKSDKSDKSDKAFSLYRLKCWLSPDFSETEKFSLGDF